MILPFAFILIKKNKNKLFLYFEQHFYEKFHKTYLHSILINVKCYLGIEKKFLMRKVM